MTAQAAETMKTAENPLRETENRGIISYVRASELPNETGAEFQRAPIEFEDSALALWEDTQRIDGLASCANRFSENYLMYCEQLEKNIKQLGSICLTKAALEQTGREFPKLSVLNLYELVCMIGFHFRKTHAVLDGLYKDNKTMGISYLNWEFRWFGLNNRLKATEVKIQKIKDGTLSVEPILNHESCFREETEKREKSDPKQPQSLRAVPNAFPLIGSMAREMARQEKMQLRLAIAKRRERVRKIKQAEKLERAALNASPVKPYPPIDPCPEITEKIKRKQAEQIRREVEEEMKAEQEANPAAEEGVPESEVRKILIEKAMREKDQEAILRIPLESGPELLERWMRYLDEQTEQYKSKYLSHPESRTGPSNETRKALREKRKKKKRG